MAKLTDFKALLFDVDGTLTNFDRQVTDETRNALVALKEAGYTVGLCTGKHYGKLVQENLHEILPADSTNILTGGAQIVRGDGTVLWEKSIDAKTAQSIYKIGDTYHQEYCVKKGLFLYGNPLAFERSKQRGQTSLFTILKPLTPEIKQEDALSIVFVEPSEEVTKLLQSLPGITARRNNLYRGRFVVDITSENVNKGTTVHIWAKMMDIPVDQIMGFGDSDNDTEFLQEVGWAVALGNATEPIQKLAHRIIGHTNNNGLAKYLESILQGADL